MSYILHDFSDDPRPLKDFFGNKELIKWNNTLWSGFYVLGLPLACKSGKRDCEDLGYKLGKSEPRTEKGGLHGRLKKYQIDYGENI